VPKVEANVAEKLYKNYMLEVAANQQKILHFWTKYEFLHNISCSLTFSLGCRKTLGAMGDVTSDWKTDLGTDRRMLRS